MGILYAIVTQTSQEELDAVCKTCGIFASANRHQCAGCNIEHKRQLEVTKAQHGLMEERVLKDGRKSSV